MGICDHEISLNISELRTLKKLLLKDSLFELQKTFKSHEEKQLYNILTQIEIIEKRYE